MHTYRTIGDTYGLPNLNFPSFWKILELLENQYTGSC